MAPPNSECSHRSAVRRRSSTAAPSSWYSQLVTKSPPLESAHDLQARIHEAERYAPLERLALSPQCGFSTSIVGNRISIEEEQRKLVRIVEVAQAVWGSV